MTTSPSSPKGTHSVARPVPRPRPARSSADKAPVAIGGWTMIDVAAVVAVFLASLVVKDALLGSRAVELMPRAAQVATRVGILAALYAAQVGLLVLLARRHGGGIASAFRLTSGSSSSAAGLVSAAMVTALLVATRLFSTLWGAAAQAVGWGPPAVGHEAFTDVFGAGAVGLGLTVVMAVMVAPLVEELAFRGVMAQGLASRFGRNAAIAGSAAVFALYHVTPWLWVPMFGFGCALAWLALTRETLWPAIALHATYNGVVVAAAFWLAR